MIPLHYKEVGVQLALQGFVHGHDLDALEVEDMEDWKPSHNAKILMERLLKIANNAAEVERKTMTEKLAQQLAFNKGGRISSSARTTAESLETKGHSSA